ncbi:RteC domain-containing protein [Epilithonimonas hungarica]|uniref:RteC protein n=1 Tax=Epilithonimonas hungarica TaxID=454006 RepID=A0A1G7SD49_9FLAO|nr:RteC domain-containing protein [Epilithonimonas hungarica]SDG20901.1 RteC protein [Epilithonimonas hungarica]
MKEYFNEIYTKLNDAIVELSLESENQISLSENVICKILETLSDLKKYVLKLDFKNQEEEIYFFKELKPKIVSLLIYHNSIYKIETKKPYGGNKSIKKYLNNELSKLKRYFDNNLEFYKYYRTNSTYLDHKYFVRGKHDIKLSLDSYSFEADQCFSTSHDYKVAKIIANDQIQVYLEDYLYNAKPINKSIDSTILNWTGSKTALIELIYALHSFGVFDNGNTDIKLIAKSVETLFNIDLGDFYHTFLEIRNRKINRTKFLDALRESLVRKMDEQDEK